MSKSNAVGKLRQIVEAADNNAASIKSVVLRELGPLKLDVMRYQVLVVTHPGSKYYPGTSILRADKDLQEQQYQGNCALIVALGPLAFGDFSGVIPQIGDWVLVRPADGLHLYINQVPCRLFEDTNIKMRVDDPELYW